MPIPQTPSTVDPGPAGNFKWKGLNWRKQTYLKAQAANVIVNADGTITCRQTAAGGMEMETTKGGLGYGDYYIVTDADLAALPPGVVWGGHFPYDQTDGSQEFDCQEASTWGQRDVTFSPHHWRHPSSNGQINAIRFTGAAGGNAPSTAGNPFKVPSGGPWCHVTKWRPGRVEYFIYRALDASDPSKLYWAGFSTTGIPVPKNSTTQHINLWQNPRSDAPKPCTVRILDFAFIPMGTAPANPTTPDTPSTPAAPPANPPAGSGAVVGLSVTIGSSSFPLAGINVARGADQLVLYSGIPVTTTNEWGVEVLVEKGVVTKVVDRRGTGNAVGLSIPAGAMVLSGHDKAADWLRAHAKVGTPV